MKGTLDEFRKKKQKYAASVISLMVIKKDQIKDITQT